MSACCRPTPAQMLHLKSPKLCRVIQTNCTKTNTGKLRLPTGKQILWFYPLLWRLIQTWLRRSEWELLASPPKFLNLQKVLPAEERVFPSPSGGKTTSLSKVSWSPRKTAINSIIVSGLLIFRLVSLFQTNFLLQVISMSVRPHSYSGFQRTHLSILTGYLPPAFEAVAIKPLVKKPLLSYSPVVSANYGPISFLISWTDSYQTATLCFPEERFEEF